MPLSCEPKSCEWLMYRKGDISCQPGLSHLSESGFINHVWLHMGEQPPFGWGLKHLWHRAKLSAVSWNHIWKCYMSRTCFKGEHIREDWCPSSFFKVWWDETFTGAVHAADEKAFICLGRNIAEASEVGKGYRGHLDKVTVNDISRCVTVMDPDWQWPSAGFTVHNQSRQW